jgi:ABC-2 type transport system permease protein
MVKAGRIFFNGALLSYKALFRWLSPTSYTASKILMPLFQILFFTLLGRYATGPRSTSFYTIGNAMQVTALSGIYGVTVCIAGERWDGTLTYLLGAPANRLLVFGGRAFMHVLDGSLSLITVNVMFINNTVYFLLLVFSGANIPLANFPHYVQWFSYSLPLTRGILSARQAVMGASLAEVAPLLVGEFIVGAIYFLIGYTVFRWFEGQAKRRGTLEEM